MALDADQPLDPTKIASREFSSSFRGYDVDEVRTYLRQMADELRSEQTSRPGSDNDAARLKELVAERKDLLATIERLENDVAAATADTAAAIERAEAAEALADPATWDESRIDALVGQETAHVLEAARTAAASIRSRAEADAEARLTVAEERQRATETEIAEQRKTVAEETQRLVTEAETKAEALRSESEATAEKLLADATSNAASTDEAARVEADRLRSEAADEADRVRAEAAEAGEALRAEGEADLNAARDRAREETQLMLAEAQSVREKVLADLVKRRRTGRTQLDQIKAARDRMARSLAVVRRELDEAIEELALSVPEAKAAMEDVGRAAQSAPDERTVLELASALDRQRAQVSDGEELDAVGVVDALGDAATSPTIEEPTSAGGAEAGAAPEPEPEATKRSTDAPVVNELADAEPVETESGDAEPAEQAQSSASVQTADEPKLPALFAQMRSSADDEVVIDLDDADDDPGVDVPQVFMDRDVAMTRFGPSLRRQLKRALADDQSDLLDRVRQSKKRIGLDDLPPVERQVLAYLDAVADSINGAARAGAEAAGDSVGAAAEAAVAELIERLADAVARPLRGRVERSITAVDGDKEEVLEPIRANYRDARSNDVPQLADDALAEAFAIGLYSALADNTKVVWLADPRDHSSTDCEDNVLAGSVKKPKPFPTGQRAPLGGPGCRCLVVSEAMAKAQLVSP